MMYYSSVSKELKGILKALMKEKLFSSFRLVGGTSLSLQLGHRISIDIDLFSDAMYGSIDFKVIDTFLEATFPYYDHLSSIIPALGKSYTIGTSKEKAIKLDVYYTDSFIQQEVIIDGIRMATPGEIIAMKVDVIQRGGRKKDFWDLHELLTDYSIQFMLDLHKQRYAYSHDSNIIIKNFTDFSLADEDFNPICLRGKHWEFIKEDIVEATARYTKLA